MAKPIKCYDLGIDIHIVKNYNYITVYFILLKFIYICSYNSNHRGVFFTK